MSNFSYKYIRTFVRVCFWYEYIRIFVRGKIFTLVCETSIRHTSKLLCAEKNTSFFSQGHSSQGKWNLKYTNICHNFFIAWNFWYTVSRLVFDLSLNFIHILPTACLNWNFLLKLAVFNLSPNIYQKWNWTEVNLQIFCLIFNLFNSF